MDKEKDAQPLVTAEEPPEQEIPPIPEEVHERAAALARALFDLDE